MAPGYGGFVKLRVTTQSLDDVNGTVSTYLDLEDGNGFQPGPSSTYVFSQTRDEGTQVKALFPGQRVDGGSDPTKLDVDLIRWSYATLPPSESLTAVPEPGSLFVVGLGIAGLLAARRRS